MGLKIWLLADKILSGVVLMTKMMGNVELSKSTIMTLEYRKLLTGHEINLISYDLFLSESGLSN